MDEDITINEDSTIDEVLDYLAEMMKGTGDRLEKDRDLEDLVTISEGIGTMKYVLDLMIDRIHQL